MVKNIDIISIIVRTTGNNKLFLERAIFSIYCSNYKNKEVVVIYQGTDLLFLEYLKYFNSIYQEIKFVFIHNNNNKSDDRAKNLNLGIDIAEGRYLAFLDDDDMVSQDHYKELIEEMEAKSYSWGYSNCCLNKYKENYLYKKTYPYLKSYSFENLMEDNFIPIHSFIIDLKAIKSKSIIYSNTLLTRVEDYYILLNLASRYMPIVIKKIGVFYNIYCKPDKKQEEKEFIKSTEIIAKLKKEIQLNIKVDKKKLNKLKILYRILALIIYQIPIIGKLIFSRKKILKFSNDIYISLKIDKK